MSEFRYRNRRMDAERFFFNHNRPSNRLHADPIHLYTIIDAQRVCDEELAKDCPDYDRYAEAYLRLEELTPESPKEEVRRQPPHAEYFLFFTGLIEVLYQLFMTHSSHPAAIIVGAAMMGLPAILRSPITGFYVLLIASVGLAFHSLSNHLDSQAQALRRAHNADVLAVRNIQAAQVHRCQQADRVLRIAKLPLVDCNQIVLR